MPGRNQRGIWKRKTYEIIKATKRETLKGLEVGGKQYKFGRLGNMRISDPGVAREIEKRWGSYTKGATKEVVVAEVEHKWDHERDHTYTFSMPALPWARYDELGRRIKGDQHGTRTPQGAEEASAPDARTGQRQHSARADAADVPPGERQQG